MATKTFVSVNLQDVFKLRVDDGRQVFSRVGSKMQPDPQLSAQLGVQHGTVQMPVGGILKYEQRAMLAKHHRFLEATSCLRKSKGNMVRKEDWGQGKHCTLFVFENAANGHLHSAVLNPKLSGELRIRLHFGADPGENLTAIVYAEFENILEIDRNKALLYDVYDGVGRRAG